MGNTDIRLRSSKRFDLQRKVVSHMTSESWKNIPHVSYLYEPDITGFYEKFTALASEKRASGQSLSFNTILLRVIAEGLKAAPELNAILEYCHRKGEGTVHVCDAINIAVPWLLPDGRIITPVLADVQAMTLAELSVAVSALGKKISNTNIDEMLYQAVVSDTVAELKKFHLNIFQRILAAKVSFHPLRGLRGKAKKDYYRMPEEHRLSARNLISATVTVSNIGSLYKEQKGCFGILEIIPPQIFAVGLGAVQEKLGVYVNENGEKEIGIRKVLPMCLAFDHRAVDFNTLVPFLKKLDEIFANPQIIRMW